MVEKIINITLINILLYESIKRIIWNVNEEIKLNNINVVER